LIHGQEEITDGLEERFRKQYDSLQRDFESSIRDLEVRLSFKFAEKQWVQDELDRVWSELDQKVSKTDLEGKLKEMMREMEAMIAKHTMGKEDFS